MGPRAAEALEVSCLLLASLGLYLVAARVLGLAPGELSQLTLAADSAALLAPGGGRSAPGGLGLAPVGVTLIPSVLGGVLAGPLGRWGVDAMTALRLGVVLPSALIPALVYALARPRLGPFHALLAGSLVLLTPRGAVACATLGGDGPLAAFWWATLWAHQRSARGRWGWALAAGLFFGVALSLGSIALLLLPVLLLDHALDHRASAARLARRGLFSAPLSAVAAGSLGLLVAAAMTPALWRQPLEHLLDLLVVAASPQVGPGLWGGDSPLVEAIPRGHGAAMLLLGLPSFASVAAVAGLVLLGREWWRRRGTLSGKEESDHPTLALLSLAALLLWPLVCPPALARFPGRWFVMVPGAAWLAAWGARRVSRGLAALGPVRARWARLALLSPLLAAVLSAGQIGGASAGYPWLAGGPWRAASAARVPLHDGTPLGALAGALDRAAPGGELRLYAPGFTPADLDTLRRLGRLRTRVTLVPWLADADAALLTGRATGWPGGPVLGRVRWDGQPILTLIGRPRG
jgi:hypothetical protein